MAELSKAKKLRVAAKGWVTRSVAQAQGVLDKKPKDASKEEVEQILDEFC